MKHRLILCLACFCSVSVGAATQEVASDETSKSLFNGQNFNGWEFHVQHGKVPWQTIWSITANGEIKANAKGNPQSGMCTEQDDLHHYRLSVQYRWLEQRTSANSGIWILGQGDFVRANGAFPKSIEVQLRRVAEGDLLRKGVDIAPEPGFEQFNTPGEALERRAEVERPVGEWNDMVITTQTESGLGTTIRVDLNGQRINKGVHASHSQGRICLQAEGSDILFRNVTLVSLPPEPR